MNYWTAQIHYISEKMDITEKPMVEELKDFEDAAIGQFSNTVWTKGFRKTTAPSTWELVSPYRITQIFIIQQKQKYGI